MTCSVRAELSFGLCVLDISPVEDGRIVEEEVIGNTVSTLCRLGDRGPTGKRAAVSGFVWGK